MRASGERDKVGSCPEHLNGSSSEGLSIGVYGDDGPREEGYEKCNSGLDGREEAER